MDYNAEHKIEATIDIMIFFSVREGKENNINSEHVIVTRPIRPTMRPHVDETIA